MVLLLLNVLFLSSVREKKVLSSPKNVEIILTSSICGQEIMSQYTLKKTAYVTGNSIKSYVEKKGVRSKETSINQVVILNTLES